MKIPKELLEKNRWVVVKQNSKIPFNAKDLKPASSSDIMTWSSFEQAKSRLSKEFTHLGFVFDNIFDLDDIIGIDIDDGFDENGFINELSIDIINKCKSFTEKSKSGRGWHIFVKGKLPFMGKNNQNGVEIYKSQRYFVMTGDQYFYEDIIENQEAIDYILEKYFNALKVSQEIVTPNKQVNYTWFWQQIGKMDFKKIYPSISEGTRNISLTSVAGQLKNLGYSKEEMQEELEYANETACNPPVDNKEIRQIVRSIMRYKD